MLIFTAEVTGKCSLMKIYSQRQLPSTGILSRLSLWRPIFGNFGINLTFTPGNNREDLSCHRQIGSTCSSSRVQKELCEIHRRSRWQSEWDRRAVNKETINTILSNVVSFQIQDCPHPKYCGCLHKTTHTVMFNGRAIISLYVHLFFS